MRELIQTIKKTIQQKDKKCASTDCISEKLQLKPNFKRSEYVCERCIDYAEGWL